jgi:hypothetical protein
MPTLQQSINWSQAMLGSYIPLSAATGSEPAISIANMVTSFILSPPFTWPTNRGEISLPTMTPGTQDYVVTAANFGFLEKVSLTNPANSKSFEIKTIYNTSALGISNEQLSRPNACSVKLITPNLNFSLRFLSAPDLAYTGTATYQMTPIVFTSLIDSWDSVLPPNQIHIYNNLFLSECFVVNGDEQSAAQYRRRGMAALLATAEGLTDMQKSMIFAQAMYSDLQTMAATLRAQSAAQARAI